MLKLADINILMCKFLENNQIILLFVRDGILKFYFRGCLYKELRNKGDIRQSAIVSNWGLSGNRLETAIKNQVFTLYIADLYTI